MPLDYMYDRASAVELLGKHVKGDRYDHSLRVEKTAVDLAKLHGVNQAQAGLAGLLHDITKQMNNEKLQDKYGVGNSVHKTMHGPTGAAWLHHHGYIEDPDVLSAIRYHTTGRPSMNMLEKIIYLADATEPGRDYPGVEELRELARTNLDEAMMFALDRSLRTLLDRESLIDLDTVNAYNYYRRMFKYKEEEPDDENV